MNITSSGRPLGSLPLFRLADGEGRYLCLLSRIDVSDVRNEPKVEGFYRPLLVFTREDQMTTVELRFGKKVVIIFFAPRKVDWYVFDPDQETER